MEALKKAIETLAAQIENAKTPQEAQQLAQAVLNLAHAAATLHEALRKAIGTLATQAENAKTPQEAQRLSQAVLNLAHAAATLHNVSAYLWSEPK